MKVEGGGEKDRRHAHDEEHPRLGGALREHEAGVIGRHHGGGAVRHGKSGKLTGFREYYDAMTTLGQLGLLPAEATT